jgi:hypothetical protein
MSAQGFYRFAAADTASDAFRPKAISYVMAGGLVSAIIGPQLVKVTADAMVVPFLGTYLAVIGVNLVGTLLFLGLDIPKPPVPAADAPKGRSRWELLTTPRIAVAVICAMVSYALMNLVMTSTPLAVVGCGYDKGMAADIVSAHVLAMFAPSFFTGHLIARFGAERIVGTGLAILAAAGAVAIAGVELENFFVALILLGPRLELRLHRRDRDARGLPRARGAGPGAGDERHDRLRLRDACELRLGRADELLGRLARGGLDGGQPLHDPLPRAGGRRADLARDAAAGAGDLSYQRPVRPTPSSRARRENSDSPSVLGATRTGSAAACLQDRPRLPAGIERRRGRRGQPVARPAGAGDAPRGPRARASGPRRGGRRARACGPAPRAPGSRGEGREPRAPGEVAHDGLGPGGAPSARAAVHMSPPEVASRYSAKWASSSNGSLVDVPAAGGDGAVEDPGGLRSRIRASSVTTSWARAALPSPISSSASRHHWSRISAIIGSCVTHGAREISTLKA